MKWLINKIVGTQNARALKKLNPLVVSINEQEEKYRSLTDAQLQAKTAEFRERLAGGATLDDLLVEAFAAVKNACRRLVGARFEVCGMDMTWDMVPFDVQIMGGIVLHQGKIAEMATGEGKTLVATMPLYLNALAGGNVHLVTVNDYLARRDEQWMGQVYNFLGISVGCIQNTMRPEERRREYAKDITYGTNSEFGFDYLRDQMAYSVDEMVQNGFNYAIIDEIDNILIDEARTPLIISGPVPESTHKFDEVKPPVERMVRKQREFCNELINQARELLDKGDTEEARLKLYQVRQGMPKNKQLLHMMEDSAARRLVEQVENAMLTDTRKEQARALREELFFTIDERGHDATLTEKGCSTLNPSDPDMYVMPDLISELSALDGDKSLSDKERKEKQQQIQSAFGDKSERIHNVNQLIRAYSLYEKDVEYVVQDNRILIVDEFTGRILPGRRWSDGLHQAIEAKEGVKIENETQTLATITVQNYFRMYKKLAGMTGTAETEANEFKDIYGLDVAVIRTNRPVRRVDFNDCIYRTRREKYKALIDEITACHKRGQPVLVGTISVDTSEVISRMLKREKIPHNVLNAKQHQREAEIVKDAGQAGMVTIATNMAGRGTDIKLGQGVVYLDKKLVESGLSLDDRIDGATLRQMLTEKPCGLRVLGSERHEARRIDRQLRGRCARQGDPGSSRFFISLEDDLMRLFGSDRIANIMTRMGMEEGEPLEHRLLNRSVETAQRRVEQHNYYIRKRTLEYDDVMNKQRSVIYEFRGQIVRGEHPREILFDVAADVIEANVESLLSAEEETPFKSVADWANMTFPIGLRREDLAGRPRDPESVAKFVFNRVKSAYEVKIESEEPELVVTLERHLMLHAIDSLWQDYLRSIDNLRQSVNLRAYGHQDPLVEYKREAFDMFSSLMDSIKKEIISDMFRATIRVAPRFPGGRFNAAAYLHGDISALAEAIAKSSGGSESPARAQHAGAGPAEPFRRSSEKVGRNAPCPCGSGKKYKKCCGALT